MTEMKDGLPVYELDPLACQITGQDVIAELQQMLAQKELQIAQLIAAHRATEKRAREVLAERDAEIRRLTGDWGPATEVGPIAAAATNGVT